MTEERLRELEWAAAFVRSNPVRVGCRCAGTCAACAEIATQLRKIGPDTITELVLALREARASVAVVAGGPARSGK